MGTPNTQHIENARQSSSEADVVYSSQLAYHELAEVPVQSRDLVEQLNANLRQLEDLQARMKFMMREIRYLMKV